MIETRRLHFLAFKAALNDLNLDMDEEEHSSIYDGLPTFKKVELLAEKMGLNDGQQEFLNRRKQEYTKLYLEQGVKESRDLVELFKYIRTKGVKIGVCSNSKRATLNYVLEKLGVAELLDFSLSNEDVSTPKPSPEIYNKALSIANCQPDQALILEDSAHGLRAALESRANVEKVASPRDLTQELFSRWL